MNPGDKFCLKRGSKVAEISHPSTRISTPEDECASSSSSTKSLSQHLASKAEERKGYRAFSHDVPICVGNLRCHVGVPYSSRLRQIPSNYANNLNPHVKKRYFEKIRCIGIDPILIPDKA